VDRTCWAEGGELVMADPMAGAIRWRGQVAGTGVFKAIPAPATTDCIVLLDWRGKATPTQGFRNVVRLRADRSVIWTAPVPIPGSGDFYTDIQWTSNGFGAYSWSAYGVSLDPLTGQINSNDVREVAGDYLLIGIGVESLTVTSASSITKLLRAPSTSRCTVG
jgi:hypothetical protein